VSNEYLIQIADLTQKAIDKLAAKADNSVLVLLKALHSYILTNQEIFRPFGLTT
jgi:hypothetical protein